MKSYLSSILLPTEELTQLLMMQSSLVVNDNKYTPHYIKLHHYKSQYIYITSTLRIKDGNWKYCSFTEAVTKYDPLAIIPGTGTCEDCRKIEFTNDPKLIADGVPALPKKTWITNIDKWSMHGILEVDFLEEFIKRYMKKSINDEIGKIPAYETGLTAEESGHIGFQIGMWCELEEIDIDERGVFLRENATIKTNNEGEAEIHFE